MSTPIQHSEGKNSLKRWVGDKGLPTADQCLVGLLIEPRELQQSQWASTSSIWAFFFAAVVWICRGLSRYVGICRDTSGFVGICRGGSGYVGIRQDLSQFIWICQDLSELC